ncbi:MAG: fucose isomerase, partial [Lachnospiraceae bacterium]|nr:fucose isomerase [Lachnospiraceae bacterium]
IYGTLSEYIGLCISQEEVTLLDINNSVPHDMYDESIAGKFDYKFTDTFMGFHCGNTCSTKVCNPHLSYQRIMARTHPQDWCDGTIEGDIVPGKITFYRLQSTADNVLRAYVAEGEVLPVATQSFGGIGVFAIPEMGRFYRYWLIGKNFPHHGAVAFGHYGKALFDALKLLGVADEELGYNHPACLPYKGENPFK